MSAKLVDNLGSAPKFWEVCLVAIALLLFAAFLHYNELSQLCCSDIATNEQYMTVPITASKTDQFQQGDLVIITKTGSSSCPVSMLERYMVAAELTTTLELQLFSGIVTTKNVSA